MEFEEKIIGEIRKQGEEAQGKIKCILYSKEIPESIPFFLPKEIAKKVENFIVKNRQLNYVFNLEINGKNYKVIVRDRQKNYLKDETFHIDFLALHPKSRTNMKAEIIFLNKGNSSLEKTNKVYVMSSPKFLPIRCIGDQTISQLSIDLNNIQSDSKMYANELKWPSNISCNSDRLVLKAVTKKIVEKATGKEKGKKKK